MDEKKIGMSEKDDPAEVAKTGFDALLAGEDHVVAGSFMNKVQATIAHVLPDTWTAEMHRKQAEPPSNSQLALLQGYRAAIRIRFDLRRIAALFSRDRSFTTARFDLQIVVEIVRHFTVTRSQVHVEGCLFR